MKRFMILTLLFASFAFAAAQPQTSLQQAIAEDFQNGIISNEEFVTNLINSVKAPELLPERYSGMSVNSCGTMPLLEAYNQLQAMSEFDRARMRPELARPWGLTQTYSTTHFLFHYTTSGSDATNTAFVTQMGTAFENAWAHLATTRGFATPPSDGSAGGDSKYDIYIRNLSTGILGYCEPEASVPSTPHNDATSFINMRNSYSAYSSNPIQLMQMTAVHELFHAFQMGYDASESPWWMEVTAVWIEDNMYPTYNDEHGYLPNFFSNPDMTIQTYNGEHEYGSYHFATYLTSKFGINTVRQIWDQCKWVAVLAAIQGVASDGGSSRNAAFSEFFVWNLFTGSRSAAGHYLEGALFPEVRIEDIVYSGEYPVAGGTSTRKPDNLASNYFKLMIPAGARGPFSVSFDGDNAGIWSAQLVFPRSATYTAINIPLDTYGYGYYVVPESVYSAYTEVYLVVGMLSTSGNDWNFVFSAAFDTITAALNPPRNLRATSGLSGRVPLEWDAPVGGGGEEEIIYDDGGGESYVALTPGDIEGVRFTYSAPCTLVSVKFMAYSTGAYPNMQVLIYPESGGAVPDTTAAIGAPRVVAPAAAPAWTTLSVATENIALPAGDFFVGLRHTAVEPALLLDTGSPSSTDRCWGWASTGFWGFGPGTGVFMLRAVVRSHGRLFELTARGEDGLPLALEPTSPYLASGMKEPVSLEYPIISKTPRSRPEEPVLNYRVFRSNAPGGPWTWPIATPTTQSYTDLSVIDGNTYYYIVTAQYGGGESSPTNQVSATPSASGGDTTGADILINANLADTTAPLSYWPLRRGTKFAERLELDRPAKIKSLLFYALNVGAGQFVPGIHHWTGDRIEGDLLPAIAHSAVGTTLVVIDVDAYDIYVNSDFVVSFGIHDSTSFILSQRIPSDDHDWMNTGFGWFIPDSSRFIIGAQVEYVDSTERFTLRGRINLSGGTGGSPAPSDLSGSIVKIEGLDLYDTTNATGYYEIRNLEPGTYIVSASRIWYETQSALVSLNSDQTKDFNLIPYNLPVNPPRLLTAESFLDGRVPLRWWPPMGSPGTAEWHTYWETPDSLFYYRPNLPAGSVECTRFDLWAPCTLTMARMCFYDSSGIYSNIEFHIWGDDGAGFPDFSNDLITPRIISPVPYSPTAGLQWTYVNLESLGIPVRLLPGDQVHIGVRHITTHPSLIFDDSTPLETPTRSKIFDASISNWDANMADFLVEVYAKYFDYSSRPAGPPAKPEPPEINLVSKEFSRIYSSSSPRMRPMAGIAVEFYDIYHTTNLADTTSFTLIATVPGDSTNWTHMSATNGVWNAYYLKTHQSHGISTRSGYATAYPKANVDSAKVLLVDDDGSSWGGGIDESWAYIDALDSLGVAFNAIDLNGPWVSGPTPATMYRYDVVIWFTGIQYSDSTTLMNRDEDNIETYLTAGGKFALFAQDYLWDRYSTGVSPTSFPARTFGLDSVQQDVCSIPQTETGLVLGYTGGPFSGMGMRISSPFGNWDLAPDGLYGPQQLARLSYGPFDGPSITGKTSGTSKTIFSSIPLSAIWDTTAANSKYAFMSRLLDDYFELFGPENVDISYNVRPGWNLLSIPVELADYSVDVVFPGHSSEVYYYNPSTSAYVSTTTVEPGVGYWVLYTATSSFTHSGPAVVTWTRPLGTGWNLVGSVWSATSVPFANASFVPNVYLTGNFYRYDGTGYVASTGFESGNGYWVLVGGTCSMTLSATAGGKFITPDACEQKLYACGIELSLGLGERLAGRVPPPAPFGSGPKAALLEDGESCLLVVNEEGRFILNLYEDGSLETNGPWAVSIEGFGRIVEGERISLKKGSYSLSLMPLPKTLSLHSAIPNPFNATAKIGFDLPEDSEIKLEVFDIQGRLVRKLVEGELQSGSHSVIWDGRSDSGEKAPSGIYLYRLENSAETKTKRMMLIQ